MSIKINGFPVEEVTFPNGEVSFKFPHHILNSARGFQYVFNVEVNINNSSDLVRFLLFQDMLYENTSPHDLCYLVFPFFPYSRADRRFKDMPFSLKTFCNMVNLDFWDTVTTYDVHNPDPIEEYLGIKFENSMFKTMKAASAIFMGHVEDHSTVCIVAPDAGSYERAVNFYQEIEDFTSLGGYNVNFKSLIFDKVRDESSGKILNIKPADRVPEADLYILVDDICDAGGTFLGVADHLPKDKKKILFVTHGYFSKGTQLLTDAFDAVYTSSTVYKGNNEKVFVV